MATNGLQPSKRHYVNGEGSTNLHTVDIWTSEDAPIDGIWLIYIHGGAWRDPTVDSQSFAPAVTDIWNSPLKQSISGFASINYRLSPYPSHETQPSSPEDPSRNARYPDHVQDVGYALFYLEEQFKISNRYLLIGHSAGATMAYELGNWYFPERNLPIPRGILGVSGIYNFEAFIKAHSHPAYLEFMTGAFPDRSLWERASPVTCHLPSPALWQSAHVTVVAHSEDDELVESEQAVSMLERLHLEPQGNIHFLEATGKHDEIWKSGSILANLIFKSIKLMRYGS